MPTGAMPGAGQPAAAPGSGAEEKAPTGADTEPMLSANASVTAEEELMLADAKR